MDFSIYTYGMIGLTTVIIAIATIMDSNKPVNNITQNEKQQDENTDENTDETYDEKQSENNEEKIDENHYKPTNKPNNFMGGIKTYHYKKNNGFSTNKKSRKTQK
jgi:LytS/YehU family sensor histidine kinase